MRRFAVGLLFLAAAFAQGFRADLRAQVEPLLGELVQNARLLAQAARAYAEAPTLEGLNRLRVLWHLAREPWEVLEAFAFGPVGDFDPYLDTWPVSPEDLRRTLGKPVEDLPPEVRGFHALEYLLYQEPARTPEAARHLALLAEDLAQKASRMREAYLAYLEEASETDLTLELYAASLELAEELFAEKLKNPESPYAQRSAQDYRANVRGLLQAFALLPLPGPVWALALDLERAVAALPSPLEGNWDHPQVALAIARAQDLHRALAQAPVGDAGERALLWLRTFREEYLVEGEVDEGLAALEGLRAALAGMPQEEEALKLVVALEAKVRAQAPAEEVEPLLRALEALFR
ncbi:hypothetical protein TJA_16120 [Thermus sp. LT1-2-5]|uniref:imelysin family protein n=1 Tax=Thermus sp. LT1-2-5 TaxID=3026935 RepID=UPI0030E97F92